MLRIDRKRPRVVREATQRQLGMYGRFHFYKDMFAKSGYPDAGEGFSQALVDDLVVYRNEKTVAKRLSEFATSGIGDVLAHPLPVGSDPQTSLMRAFAAVADSKWDKPAGTLNRSGGAHKIHGSRP
jgi:hypothetical protein